MAKVAAPMSFKQKLLECIRQYEAANLIDDNDQMSKSLTKRYHDKHLKKKYNMLFITVLGNMVKTNIIFHPSQTNDPKIIVFKPGKLDLILEGHDTYISKSENKFIISQTIGFRSPKKSKSLHCDFCNRSFGSDEALRQHNRAKDHVGAKLKKIASKPNFYEKRSKVYAEIRPGMGNAPETITSEQTMFEKTLIISNMSTNIITIEEISHINVGLNHYMTVVYEPRVTVPVLGHIDVPLQLNFDSARSYNMPLSISYSNDEGMDGFNKHLVFEIVSVDFHDLLPTSPYQRPIPVASDMDETIIPGVRPDFETKFEFLRDLKRYPLTADFIKVINSGMKLVTNDKKILKIQSGWKQLLDVEEPMNCLTQYNYREMLDLLLYLEEHQMQIDIRNYDQETTELRRVSHHRYHYYELMVPDLAENRPSLVVGDSVYAKEIGASKKYEGNVHIKNMDSVVLAFDVKFHNLFVPKMKLHISFGYNRTTLKLEHQAAELAQHCASYFFPTEIKVNNTPMSYNLNFFNKNLNKNAQQAQAVQEIVNGTATNMPYLIFGPPGTGKTMTVVEAILQVHKQFPDKRILICAPSNSAADLICTRLLKFSKFNEKELLRFISISYSSAELPAGMERYCNVQNKKWLAPTLDSFDHYKLVITTLTSAGRLYNAGIPKDHFSYVFIDEAGHATETETLIPITAVLTNFDKVNGQVILAGDPKQLGPIIHSSKAKEYGFGVSMLERLMNTRSVYQKGTNGYDNRVLTKLLKNYRSHPEIISISNECFYDNELICEGNEFSNIALGHGVLINTKFPMIFHNVLGTDEREANSPSFFNIQEIEKVFYYLNILIGTRMSGKTVMSSDIAVITPYRKQAKKIMNKCGNVHKFNGLTVGSVEKLQGQERLIIIISTVRSKPEYIRHDVKFHLGFLKNYKRFNVAITRAKALVIVIGNGDLLKHDEHWAKYIQKCLDNNATAGPAINMQIDELDANLIDGFENIVIEDDIQFGRGNQ